MKMRLQLTQHGVGKVSKADEALGGSAGGLAEEGVAVEADDPAQHPRNDSPWPPQVGQRERVCQDGSIVQPAYQVESRFVPGVCNSNILSLCR